MPCRLALTQQQPGDDEPRDDEEDFDADVATAESGYARVVDEARRMAMARIPCTSGRNFRSPGGVPASSPVAV